MLGVLKRLFSSGPTLDYAEMFDNGAKIIDVRTPAEFKGGHITGSVNIPLQSINGKIKKLDKNKTYILCCASGARSGRATGILKSKGFENVHNGGGWMRLNSKL